MENGERNARKGRRDSREIVEAASGSELFPLTVVEKKNVIKELAQDSCFSLTKIRGKSWQCSPKSLATHTNTLKHTHLCMFGHKQSEKSINYGNILFFAGTPAVGVRIYGIYR